MLLRHWRWALVMAGGAVIIAAAVVGVLVSTTRDHSSGANSEAAQPTGRPTPHATPGGPYTPSPDLVVNSEDDALRLAVLYSGEVLSSAKLDSVQLVYTDARSALNMFGTNQPNVAQTDVAVGAQAWVIVATGTFVEDKPLDPECPCTHHMAWVIAVRGTETVLTGWDYSPYDLSALGTQYRFRGLVGRRFRSRRCVRVARVAVPPQCLSDVAWTIDDRGWV